ncbi:MAG: ATP-binding protein [Nostoc sp. DedQUE04]|uniref:sensor histidine kinase n=1 Tax=Nostoc sp. DedQUE04 TaxID=3075390 RepID=UPI002AD3C42E|nr:ATP-binding protein [Nostoc sp. DedQUE04]MDZ8136159.1 ATP-binding protein [Nostoc sp. DedQUE04]
MTKNDSLQILLIEDSPEDADILQEFLENTDRTSWKVTVVEKLRIALEKLHCHSFNVILSDLSLPDAHGLETIAQLHTAAPTLPIVVLTSLKDEAIALEAVRQGAQDYLVKGQINTHALIRSIHYAIERSRMQQIMHQQSVAIAVSSEGIAILDAQWNYVYVNEAYSKIYGYKDSSLLLQTNWKIHYHPNQQAGLRGEIEQSLQQRKFWRGETVGYKCNSQPFDQELSISLLPHGGTVCILRDISDRKRAEAAMQQALQQARELHQLKSEFITMVSHEFRTPLSVILVATETLKRYAHQWTPEKNQIRYNRIIAGVQRMTELLNDMLVMNSSGPHQAKLNPVPLNLEKFCQELIATLTTSEHPIIFESQGNSRQIYLDPTVLELILTHLLSNAIKYSLDSGKVMFDLIFAPEHVTFSIQDWGIGIPLEDQDKLFIPFYRGSNVGNLPGTGIGLAIVKQFVEECQGVINVTSQMNQGTLIRVTLPIALVEQIHDQNPGN